VIRSPGVFALAEKLKAPVAALPELLAPLLVQLQVTLPVPLQMQLLLPLEELGVLPGAAAVGRSQVRIKVAVAELAVVPVPRVGKVGGVGKVRACALASGSKRPRHRATRRSVCGVSFIMSLAFIGLSTRVGEGRGLLLKPAFHNAPRRGAGRTGGAAETALPQLPRVAAALDVPKDEAVVPMITLDAAPVPYAEPVAKGKTGAPRSSSVEADPAVLLSVSDRPVPTVWPDEAPAPKAVPT
jgi:hypothetical protein